MKLYLIRCLLILGAVTLSQLIFCQEFKNDAAQREKHFVSQVKQIDEFFERFNNDTSSFIRGVYKSYNTKFNIERTALIKSLFNYETKSWTKTLLDSFTKQALLIEMPTGRNWYGDSWYAELNCRFEYNAGTIDIPLVLRTITDEKKRSKWVITGVKQNTIKTPDSQKVNIKPNKSKFIDPSSHGTKFIELERDFNDKENLSDYFDNNFFYHDNSLSFYEAILKNKLKFLFVRDIRYHFLNVNQYIFTVEYFPREALNSGWLISSLKTANTSEKIKYKNILLGY